MRMIFNLVKTLLKFVRSFDRKLELKMVRVPVQKKRQGNRNTIWVQKYFKQQY